MEESQILASGEKKLPRRVFHTPKCGSLAKTKCRNIVVTTALWGTSMMLLLVLFFLLPLRPHSPCWVWTPGLILARWALCHLSHSTSSTGVSCYSATWATPPALLVFLVIYVSLSHIEASNLLLSKVFFFFFFKIGSCPLARANSQLMILLPQPPKFWDYRHVCATIPS
jgi:hypothetical protein